jgi:hypothetical protein
MERDLEGVTMEPTALMTFRNVRKAVGCLERELLEDLSQSYVEL